MSETKKSASRNKEANQMRKIKLEKITLNMGGGTEAEGVEKAVTLLAKISGGKPVKTKATRRIPTWKVRPGLPVGAMVTVRGKKALEMLRGLLKAVENKVKKSSFTKNGFSFGVKEYIEIPGIKYDPKLGILGLEVAVSLQRAGFRVKRRKLFATRIHHAHEISGEDAWKWAVETFGITDKEED